jgi:cellulose synthase/poly-beta-1,6-N-acetylglucosamine synthase-like glycosyltransferase/peptidoglycan/xylan/chitin deacetylase (PgdA/CDA1 family)
MQNGHGPGRGHAPTVAHRKSMGSAALRVNPPRPRMIITILVLAAFLAILLVEGYVHAEVFRDSRVHPPENTAQVPRSVLLGGPIIDATHGTPHSYRMPTKTIALTFDDGPDPTWTPQVLAVLRKHQVPATFFVVGELVARYPNLVKDEYTQGHEIGLHTFTHPDLEYQQQWRRDLELTQTQLALAGAIGKTSSLLRPPYSSEPIALDDLSWPIVQEFGKKGYVTALVNVDTEDWSKPGVAKIVDNGTPKVKNAGAVVLLHDAGGDRSQTAAGLDQLITELQAKGYTFTTISGALGAPSADTQASSSLIWRGRAMIWVVGIADKVVPALALLLGVAGVIVMARLVMMVLMARRHYRQRHSRRFRWGPRVTQPVSVIVPAWNEKECIEQTLRSLVASDYPALEIVMVDDGSTDGTADIAEALRLPGVRVVRQANGGKAAALNTGVAVASHDIIVMMDGDTVFEPETIRLLVQPFGDPDVGGVAGNAKVGNTTNMVSRWQRIEYILGFNLDRRMYDLMRCMPTVPGAIGAFRREALEDVGGVSEDTLAEDTDITMAMCRAGWRVVYEDSAIAWTEAPTTLNQLYKQRYRWSYGTMQAMWKHRHAVVERGASGHFGRVGLPMIAAFQVVLPALAPLIDVFLLYGVLFLDPVKTIAVWLAVLGLQMLSAVYAFRLDRESMRDLWRLPLQQFVYRQLMYAVLIQSIITAMTGGLLRWHKLDRSGELSAGPPSRTPVAS